MRKRGAVFYIIDSFMAAAIVLLTIIVVVSSFSYSQDSDVLYLSLDNFLTFFESVQFRDIPGGSAATIRSYGLVSNPSSSLIDVVVELVDKGHVGNASELVRDVSLLTLESQFGVNMSVINSSGDVVEVFSRRVERLERSTSVLKKRVMVHSLQEGSLRIIRANSTFTDWDPSGQAGSATCTAITGEDSCSFVVLDCGGVFTTFERNPGCSFPDTPIDSCTTLVEVVCTQAIPPKVIGPYVVEVSVWT